jgi:hypothetical protein
MLMNTNKALRDHIAVLEYRLIGYEQEIEDMKEEAIKCQYNWES